MSAPILPFVTFACFCREVVDEPDRSLTLKNLVSSAPLDIGAIGPPVFFVLALTRRPGGPDKITVTLCLRRPKSGMQYTYREVDFGPTETFVLRPMKVPLTDAGITWLDVLIDESSVTSAPLLVGVDPHIRLH